MLIVLYNFHVDISAFITFSVEFVLFTLIFLFLNTPAAKKICQRKKSYLVLITGILFAQIVAILFIKNEVGDVFLFSKAGHYLRLKLDFYEFDSTHSQFPFFPFLIYFHALGNFLAENIGFFTFSFYLKLLLLLPCVYLLSYQINRNLSSLPIESKRVAQLQFLASPLTYAIILFHGQVDVVLLVFFIFSVKFLLRHERSYQNLLIGSFFFACSILAKTWSIIFFPVLMKFQKNITKTTILIIITILLLAADIYLYTVTVYYTKLSNILPALIKPGGPVGIWGVTYILSSLPKVINWVAFHNLLIFASMLGIFIILILKKNSTFWQSCFLLILGVYLVIPNWGFQYLFWIWPFLFMIYDFLRKRDFLIFNLISSIYLFMNYGNIAFGKQIIPVKPILLTGLFLWLFIFYWFVKQLKTFSVQKEKQ